MSIWRTLALFTTLRLCAERGKLDGWQSENMQPTDPAFEYIKLASVALAAVIAAYGAASVIRELTGWGSPTVIVVQIAVVTLASGLLLSRGHTARGTIVTAVAIVISANLAEFVAVLLVFAFALVILPTGAGSLPTGSAFWVTFALGYLPTFLALMWLVQRIRMHTMAS